MILTATLATSAIACRDATGPRTTGLYALSPAPVVVWASSTDTTMMLADTLRFDGGGKGTRTTAWRSVSRSVASIDPTEAEFHYERTGWTTVRIFFGCPPAAFCAAIYSVANVTFSGDQLTIADGSMSAPHIYRRVR